MAMPSTYYFTNCAVRISNKYIVDLEFIYMIIVNIV